MTSRIRPATRTEGVLDGCVLELEGEAPVDVDVATVAFREAVEGLDDA